VRRSWNPAKDRHSRALCESIAAANPRKTPSAKFLFGQKARCARASTSPRYSVQAFVDPEHFIEAWAALIIRPWANPKGTPNIFRSTNGAVFVAAGDFSSARRMGFVEQGAPAAERLSLDSMMLQAIGP